MVERKFLLVFDLVVELPFLSVMFVLQVKDLQHEYCCFSLFLLCVQTLIEDHCTPSIQFLILGVPLFGQTELAYCLGLVWARLGVVVLSWSGGLYRELVV